jgi:hypothetical protein
LSRIASTCLDETPLDPPKEQTLLEGIIPHLEFSLEISSNNLIYEGNGYTSYQLFLLTLISTLYDKGYGYRKIAKKLNKWGVKTARGNTFFNTSVSSILKKKRERDARIEEVRNKEYPIKICKFAIKYYTF